MRLHVILFACAMIPSGAMTQQGFTCLWGDRGACLGYGDTVCSSSGKCVTEDANCFSSYQCDYQGLNCKSNVDACVAEYHGLLIQFNALVDDYNQLLVGSQELRAAFHSTLEDLKEAQDRLDATRLDLRGSEYALLGFQSCIDGLARFDDPTVWLLQ